MRRTRVSAHLGATRHTPVTDHHYHPTGQDLVEEEPAEPSDAERSLWIGIYEKLIEFTEEMLELTRQRLPEFPGPAQRHLQSTNVRVMEEELAVFRKRLAWLGGANRDG